MKKIIVLAVAVLFLSGFSCPALYARGGHGGGHGGYGRGFRGGHGGGFHGGGGYYVGYAGYAAYSSYGWYGLGSFGGLYPDPWYYYGPPYDDQYLLPPDSVYPDSAPVENPAENSVETPGEWVLVPGQSVDGIWVPPHEAWAPESP